MNFANLFLPDNRPIRIPGIAGDTLEIVGDIDMGDAEDAGIHLLAAADGGEHTAITYNRARNRLSVGTPSGEEKGNLTLSPAEALRLNIFVDCSVIEVFANGRACVTGRAYPVSTESRSVFAFAKGGAAKLRSMQVFEMKPISADRLTS
jgi:beta-fructofuranosidase